MSYSQYVGNKYYTSSQIDSIRDDIELEFQIRESRLTKIIEDLSKRVDELEDAIRYAPGGAVFQQAESNFNELCANTQNLNINNKK